MQSHIDHLEEEINILKSLLQPSGTGSLHTAIDILRWRIETERRKGNE